MSDKTHFRTHFRLNFRIEGEPISIVYGPSAMSEEEAKGGGICPYVNDNGFGIRLGDRDIGFDSLDGLKRLHTALGQAIFLVENPWAIPERGKGHTRIDLSGYTEEQLRLLLKVGQMIKGETE